MPSIAGCYADHVFTIPLHSLMYSIFNEPVATFECMRIRFLQPDEHTLAQTAAHMVAYSSRGLSVGFNFSDHSTGRSLPSFPTTCRTKSFPTERKRQLFQFAFNPPFNQPTVLGVDNCFQVRVPIEHGERRKCHFEVPLFRCLLTFSPYSSKVSFMQLDSRANFHAKSGFLFDFSFVKFLRGC